MSPLSDDDVEPCRSGVMLLTALQAGTMLWAPKAISRTRPVSAVFLFLPPNNGRVSGIRKDPAVL